MDTADWLFLYMIGAIIVLLIVVWIFVVPKILDVFGKGII